MLKFCLIMFVFLYLSEEGFAQKSFGPMVRAGTSYIQNSLDLINADVKNRPSLSAEMGGFYAQTIGSTILGWEVQLLYSHIRGTELLESQIQYDANSLIRTTNSFNRRLHYISLPVQMDFSFDKLRLSAGLKSSLLISARGKEVIQLFKASGTETFTQFRSIQPKRLLDLGPTAGITYRISSKYLIDVSYTHGLINQLGNRPDSFLTLKTRQLLIGMRYEMSED